MSRDSIELFSLPGRGRAESIRMMLIYVGKEFIDTRLTIAQWKLKRKNEGFNDDTKLPVMKINDKKTFIGVLDISRYIAVSFGLYGSSSNDQEFVNHLIEELEVLNVQLTPILRATLTKNYDQRKEAWNEFKDNSLFPKLTEYENTLATKMFIIGTKYSWADIALVEMLTRFQCCYDSFYLAHFPNLKSYCTRFESLANIKPYIQTRPDSHF